MEIEGTDGSKTRLKPGSTIEFGRGLGFTSDDKTVSRRQILFQIHKDETKVKFEVVGRNPIWVYSNKDGKVSTFRKFERGEMENGDMFCVSAKKAIWFTLKRIDFGDEDKKGGEKEMEMETQLAESLESSSCPEGIEFDLEHVDISGIDPVQEFGFLVMGHEFDGYPKRMIREIKNWNWFIEDERAESDADEDSDRKGRKGARRKRKKKGKGDDDDEWTGESEDEKELLTKSKKLQGPKYVTRSKDKSNAKKSKRSTQQEARSPEEEYEEEEDEDEEDETLGGFIVDNVEDEPEVGDEEEEEEFDDDDEEVLED
ncbi:protein bfr2-like [Lycium barbarum]|uniref:protein bfr2-like n=1 Tax=Lycium barbarum TaxID=112863 RepID=UPI00293F5BFB|nr:protein bfr2-like [Lycium barbarum]